MIIPEPKQYRHSDENLLPMINIVFLLLIFFIIAGAITAADALNIQAPHSEQGQESPLETRVLLLSADGRLALADHQGHMDSLDKLLSQSSDLPETLQVKADGQTDAERLFELMRGLHKAGVKHIRLLAVDSEE